MTPHTPLAGCGYHSRNLPTGVGAHGVPMAMGYVLITRRALM